MTKTTKKIKAPAKPTISPCPNCGAADAFAFCDECGWHPYVATCSHCRKESKR